VNRPYLLGGLALFAASCASPLPVEPPPLEGLEEPVAWLAEPDDETARRALDAGAFSGLELADARATLAALTGAPEGLQVQRVIENGPGDRAGIEVGDLLLEARSSGGSVELLYQSDWRGLELRSPPGTELELLLDRGGREFRARVVLEARVRPAARGATERFREQDRVGVVLRTATEVEARAAGLAPGAGAVLVGLAASSPWRGVDLVYGDLLSSVDGQSIGHPEVLIDALRRADKGEALEVERWRGGERATVRAPVSRRETRWREVWIPLLWRYERDADRTVRSALLGSIRVESTRAAWRLRLLWIFRFSGGDAGRLEEVSS
jgi:hypothetical protein